ncbi:substrate-binding domain-containing protein [Caproiciproducens galactitolivorans]|uniref:D-ribose-binding periplasmic protein n=1 Tax=Caproiciproducens galactitolivorans TaxID=642589 RepID=A0A4Z0XZR6_9FIRM|nr:substrate-binding domain-containing protein [Caproiciproducens galactitolivorans]QEY35268.1 substrate-binding domain-containing protein [Caproiciproducens galactitolivorans]TGJ76964.1 D-ribose-binding periplasmic protein precursor [Caproiciproducens galactitolivorans]
MKRFRKIISMVLAVAMVATLAACSGPGTSSNSAASAAASAPAESKEAAKKDITVGVSLLTRQHVFYNNIENALNEKAKELGVKLIVQDANQDASKQLSQVQDFITQKVDAIILCPTNSAGSKSMVELASKANIPVLTMDVPSDGDTVCHVSTDNYKGGELAAEYLVNNVLKDKKGKAAVITYSEIEGCVNREKGFTEWIGKNAPDIKVVDVQNYSGDQAKAADVMQNMLQKHADLDAVFCVGDPAAMGALSSIKSANKKVKIIGFDGNAEGIAEIKKPNSLWIADVAQDPAAIGETALQAAVDTINGKTVEKKIAISPFMIDKTNAK